MRPFWTWRPGRKWCAKCGRYAKPHLHLDASFDARALVEGMRRATKAFRDYGAAMERVGRVVGTSTSSLQSFAKSFEAIADRENQDTSPDP